MSEKIVVKEKTCDNCRHHQSVGVICGPCNMDRESGTGANWQPTYTALEATLIKKDTRITELEDTMTKIESDLAYLLSRPAILKYEGIKDLYKLIYSVLHKEEKKK